MGDDGEAVATNGLKDNGRYWMLYWYQIGYVQIGLSSLTLLLYLMSKWQMIFREHWRGRFVDLKPLARAQRSKFQSQLKLIGLEADERAEELLNKDPRDLKVAEFKDILKLEENDPKRKLIHLRFELESIFCIIKDHYLLYSLFYLMVSIIGLYVFSLSYLLHLFDIAVLLLILSLLYSFSASFRGTEKRDFGLHSKLGCLRPSRYLLVSGHLHLRIPHLQARLLGLRLPFNRRKPVHLPLQLRPF